MSRTYRTVVREEVVACDFDVAGHSAELSTARRRARERLASAQARQVGERRRRAAALDSGSLEGRSAGCEEQDGSSDLHGWQSKCVRTKRKLTFGIVIKECVAQRGRGGSPAYVRFSRPIASNCHLGRPNPKAEAFCNLLRSLIDVASRCANHEPRTRQSICTAATKSRRSTVSGEAATTNLSQLLRRNFSALSISRRLGKSALGHLLTVTLTANSILHVIESCTCVARATLSSNLC